MRRLIQFNTIKKKIMSGFLLVIFLFLGTGTYNYITLNQLNTDIETITGEQLPRLLIDDEIALKMAERTSLLRGYVLYGDPAFKEEFEATIEESIQLEVDLLAMNDSQEVQELVDKKYTWGVATDEVFVAYDAGNVEKAMDIMQNEVKPLEDEILAGFKKLSEEREAEITLVGENLAANGDQALILEVFFILLFLVLGVLIANNCANRISRPAYVVMDRLQSLAAGDLSHDDLETKSTDEIGRLVLATNEMNRHMRGLLDEINRVSETVSRQSSELSASADEVKAGTEQVAITMEELAQGAETQANSASDLTVIMEDFNTKIEEVSNNGEQIQQNSGNVLEMTSNGSELMQSSQDQMSKIYGIVKNARENMQVLDEQAQEISKLIAVIRDIADQTNLLALNAAIEAARAGEHGSGFAVVADEVRKLAEQVALSVNDITGIVTNIQTESTVVADSLESGYKEVENGSAQIETTGKTFDEIRSFVTGMVDNIQTVSGNLSGIVSNSHQMSSSIADIASVSEEAAAGVEQTAASAEESSTSMEEMAGRTSELSRLADELHELLGQFKL